MTDAVLRFGATDNGLTAAFRRVGSQMAAFENAAKRVGSSVNGALGSLQGVIGGITFAVAIREVLQFADEIDKAAVKTGIAAASIQKLSFVAVLSGKDLGSITTAVGRMQKALVEAGEGSAEATRALSRLGIPLAEFTALAPDQQFEKVAKAIASIQSPTQRAGAAMGLFGRAGAELLPTLLDTGTKLAELDKRFAAIGGPVSDQAIKGVVEVGDSLSAAGVAAKSLGTELLGLIAPPLIAGIDALSTTIGGLRFVLRGGTGDNEQVNLSDQIDRLNGRIAYFKSVMKSDPSARTIVEQATAQVAELEARLEKLQNGGALQRVLGSSRGPSSRRAAPRDLGDLSTSPKTSGDLPKVTDTGKKIELDAESKRRIQAIRDADARKAAEQEILDAQAKQFEDTERANEKHLQVLAQQELDYNTVRLEQQSALGAALVDLRAQYGIAEIDFESFKSASIQQLNASLASSLVTIATAAFGQNKKVALAVAGISVGVGMAKALELPFPANIAAAAKVAAQGAQILAGIRSQSVGGGASLAATSGGGSASLSGTAPAAATAPTGATQAASTSIYINGNFAGPRSIDWLVDELRKATDRDVILFGGASRQSIDTVRAS